VLIVEDDPRDVESMLKHLAKVGSTEFHTANVSTLAAGIRRLQSGAFDVVLLDLSLPDSTGWDTFLRIHEHATGVPFVLLTHEEDGRSGVEAVKKGAQDYLLKGHTTPEQLARAIRYAIERKRTEVELRQYQDHLEELVVERTARLKETNERLVSEVGDRKLAEVRLRAAIERLRKHDEAQTQFVSNVSHDLKTPLASMSYAIDNMLKGVIGPVPDRVRGYLNMLREDCTRLSNTITDILDMSRIDANTLVLHKVKVPFAQFAAKIANSIRIQVEMQQQQITTRLPNASGFISCDAQKMERVLLNIIRNAIKYTPPGGHIDIQLRTDDDDILLDVIDDGIGIPTDDLDKVLDRFYRVGEHITGTGLGLTLAKEIVERHDGHLALTSPPEGQDKGTQVTIRLPKCAPPSVVAVDDDEDNLHLLERQLGADGYEVVCASNGVHALESIRQAMPDLIVTDLVMPEMSGIELIATLKTTPEYHDLAIIAITGRDLPQGHREMLAGFAIPVLVKPWSRSDLCERIEQALAAREYLGG